MLALDATTRSEYDAETTAADQAQAVVDALAGAESPVEVRVKIYDGSGAVKASGTMAVPWAAQAAGVVTIGEVSSFAITAAGAPDPTWYLRFESGSRWLRGSFGLRGESADFVLSSDAWINGYTIRLGTVVVNAPSNTAPTLVGAPTSLSFVEGTGGTYNFAPHGADAEGDLLTFSLVGTAYTGIAISADGTLTVTTVAAAAARDLVVRVTDVGGLNSDWPVTVTITPVMSVTPDFVIPSNVSSWDASASQPRFTGGSAVPNSIANPIIELSAGTSTTVATAGTRTTKLAIANLQPSTGTATIRNPAAGVVTIQAGSYTFSLTGAPTNVVVDGTNGGQTYGIRVRAPSANSYSGTLLKLAGLWNNVTIKGVEIDGQWSTFTTAFNCIGFGSNDSTLTWGSDQWQDGLRVTECYVHHCSGEGMYIGPNYSSAKVPVRNIEVDHCVVEYTGRDGLNGKNWWEGTNSVHDNTFTNVGQNTTDEDGQRDGVTITGGVGRIYNNVIQNLGERGIRCASNNGPPASSTSFADGSYGPYEYFAVEIFNNLVVNCGTVGGLTGHGMTLGGDSGTVLVRPEVYCNTVVDCEGDGVNITRSIDGWVRNNVLIDNGGTVSLGSGGATQRDNKTTGTLAVDYRLTSEDAAVGTIGTDISATDIEGTSRAGTASKGAYEYD